MNKQIVIILMLIIIIVIMTVAYSSFVTQSILNGNSQITGEWNVKIVKIDVQDISEGCEPGDTEFTNTNVKFSTKLNKPGDSATYLITIENAGTIDAKLEYAAFRIADPNGSPAITYCMTHPDDLLPAGEKTSFTVTVIYKEDTVQVPEIKTKTLTGTIEYVQK